MAKPDYRFISPFFGLLFLFTFSVLVGGFSACKKDKEGNEDLSPLRFSPSSISLTDSDTLNATLVYHNGSIMDWQVAYAPPFADVMPMMGTVGIEQASISIVTNPERFLAGIYRTQLVIMSSKEGRLEVEFNYLVSAKPYFIFEVGGMYLENQYPYSKIRFLNAGNAAFDWSIHSDKSWLTFSPNTGSAEPGELTELELQATPWLVHEGINSALVTIQPNSDTAFPLLVDYMVEPFKQLKASKDIIDLDFTNRTSYFYLVNGGTVAADWALVNNSDQLTVSPASGSLASGDSVQIVVQTISGEIVPDTYMGSIEIHYGVAEPIVVETKLVFINFDINIQEGILMGAVFNDHTEELVVITSNPNELRVINPWDGSIRKTEFSLQPTSIAISPDRQKIVVGIKPEREVIVFDYESLVVVQTITIPVPFTEPLHLTFGLNGHIYVAVKNYPHLFIINTDDWTTSFYNAGNGQTFNSHFILASPYSDHLYVPRNFRLFKYNLEDLLPEYMYDKPYQAFGFSDKIWALPDEKHLVNEKGEIFLLSDNEDLDLMPIATIPSHIKDIAMTKDYLDIAVIDQSLPEYVSFYQFESQKQKYRYYLPYMPFGHSYLPPRGRYIYMVNDPNKIIAICDYKYGNQWPEWGYTAAIFNNTEQ